MRGLMETRWELLTKMPIGVTSAGWINCCPYFPLILYQPLKFVVRISLIAIPPNTMTWEKMFESSPEWPLPHSVPCTLNSGSWFSSLLQLESEKRT